MKIAIFDVCGTLYDSNTTLDFLDYSFGNKISYRVTRYFTKTIPGKALNKVSSKLLKFELSRFLLLTFLFRKNKLEVEKMVNSFYDDHLVYAQNENVINLLNDLKSRGYHVLLVSGSLDFIIEKICKELKASNYFASSLNSSSETYGIGYEKDILHMKKEVFLNHYEKYEELIVVSDNKTDLPLFKMANTKHIVTKDKNTRFWINKGYGDFIIQNEVRV